MLVNDTGTGDWTVSINSSRLSRVGAKLRRPIGKFITKPLCDPGSEQNSFAVVPSNKSQFLNHLDVDIVNLHWINAEMMSIADIGRVSKPAVWTLHDMWAFCGTEHYADDFRWKEGYNCEGRGRAENGFDFNSWTFRRKLKHWRRPMQIVTPSQWLAQCVRQSALMRNWPVTVIPNAIDVDLWQPIERTIARGILRLPDGKRLLLFSGGTTHPRKGFDLLREALDRLQGELQGLELLILGQPAPQTPSDIGLPVHYMGRQQDDLSLRVLYSAADVLVIPSRQDNLPNTGLEGMACGTPVVAFEIGGLPDIVEHMQNGYLAKPFDTKDLASGIRWTIEDPARNSALGVAARESAVRKWSYSTIARRYEAVYQATLSAAPEPAG